MGFHLTIQQFIVVWSVHFSIFAIQDLISIFLYINWVSSYQIFSIHIGLPVKEFLDTWKVLRIWDCNFALLLCLLHFMPIVIQTRQVHLMIENVPPVVTFFWGVISSIGRLKSRTRYKGLAPRLNIGLLLKSQLKYYGSNHFLVNWDFPLLMPQYCGVIIVVLNRSHEIQFFTPEQNTLR